VHFPAGQPPGILLATHITTAAVVILNIRALTVGATAAATGTWNDVSKNSTSGVNAGAIPILYWKVMFWWAGERLSFAWLDREGLDLTVSWNCRLLIFGFEGREEEKESKTEK